jgi:hypothetical protein
LGDETIFTSVTRALRRVGDGERHGVCAELTVAFAGAMTGVFHEYDGLAGPKIEFDGVRSPARRTTT